LLGGGYEMKYKLNEEYIAYYSHYLILSQNKNGSTFKTLN